MATLAVTSFIDSGSPAMSRAGDYTGKTRTDIVYEKIDKQLPFTIGPKEGGEKVYGVSFTSKSGEKPTEGCLINGFAIEIRSAPVISGIPFNDLNSAL